MVFAKQGEHGTSLINLAYLALLDPLKWQGEQGEQVFQWLQVDLLTN